MSPYLRLRPGRRENLLAAGVALGAAAGVAAVVFYFGRILISREKVSRLEETERPGTSGRALEPPSRRAERR
jgi:hypothetical protein